MEPEKRSVSMHPRLSAYLGDAVYELWLREQALIVLGDVQTQRYHEWVTVRAKAEFQATLLEELLPTLTEAEQELVKQARNLPVPISRRKNQAVYRQATAFEALVGHWYQNSPKQLAQRLPSLAETEL